MYMYLRKFLIFVIMNIIYFFVYKENRIYSFCEINVLFKVVVVNYIFYNFVESEILGVCIIVFVFIFYDIRKR